MKVKGRSVTHCFVEDFLFFRLHVDVLHLSFGEANENVKNIRLGIVNDIVACRLMVLLVDAMIDGFTEVGLQRTSVGISVRVMSSKRTCVGSANS